MEIDSFCIFELLADIFEAWIEHNENAAQISTFVLNGC